MDSPLTLIEHLSELRKRIIISLIALCACSAACLPLASGLLRILKLPAAGLIDRLAFFSPQEAFLIYIRIAFLCGCIVSMPVILYEAWLFISPAIDEKPKRYMSCFITLCFGLFVLGALFAYFILIPPALRFLLSFAGDGLEPVISASRYISFVTALMLGCGLMFQMPALSMILTKLGIVDNRMLRRQYKYAIVTIFILAAVVTPTSDPFNMLLLAVPMLLLYEVSIWISYFVRPAGGRALWQVSLGEKT